MAALSIRRYGLFVVPALFLVLSFAYLTFRVGPFHHPLTGSDAKAGPEKPDGPPPLPRHPIYKPARPAPPPYEDNFPLAVAAKSPADLPPVPSWNRPPQTHVPEKTPLLIGFTRNWRVLQEAVVSYITAGWPPEDIYVIENTGTMDANKRGQLSLQNAFYIDYKRLTDIFGVNVISTPTLLTFSQLQNFYLHEAIERGWGYYFWSHMDVVALPAEDIPPPYKSLYLRAVDTLRQTLAPGYARKDDREGRWAIRFFAYDRLALVNAAAFAEVGGWDTMIPFYGTDCDMHERLSMAGFKQENANAGFVYDMASTLPDLEVLYRQRPKEYTPHSENKDEKTDAELERQPGHNGWVEDTLNSSEWWRLKSQLDTMQEEKNHQAGGRNSWQSKQAGGQGEPYYRDPDGFQQGIWMTIDFGRGVLDEKWGHKGCDLRGVGLSLGDAWRVEHDW
ncbi:MAG: hypothetical protein M1819_005551 [Sarea resinae]|nr:MAG: hypothetical protein M1819_005551 [Sarea resinae]